MYRPEAIAHQQDRLQGEVLLAAGPRLGWLVALAGVLALAIVAFGLQGSYTRKEHVVGWLAPSAGLVKVFTPQAGTVLESRVDEGRRVRRGDVLLVIGSEHSTLGLRDAQATMMRELKQRRDSLLSERRKQTEIDDLAATAIGQRVRSLQTQLGQIETQIALQQQRVDSAKRHVARQRSLVAAHFIAEAAMQQSEEALIDQRGQLAALQRAATALAGDLAAARQELAAAGLKRANNAAAIDRGVSELAQQIAAADTRRSVVLTAPADGTVTTLQAEPGQSVQPGVPLLTLLPAGSAMQAQLLVPTRAAGFVRPGQTVALRYQAFPYQRFGHHEGRVVDVGRAVIQPNEVSLPLPLVEPVYRVTVELPAQTVQAYGEALPLRAGMLLDADIAVDRRRLLEWMIDPLVSVTGRI